MDTLYNVKIYRTQDKVIGTTTSEVTIELESGRSVSVTLEEGMSINSLASALNQMSIELDSNLPRLPDYQSPQDPKYAYTPNGILNRETNRYIPNDEPVLTFRARDIHALGALDYYASKCIIPGHIRFTLSRIEDFERFKHLNPKSMKEPDS